MPSEADSNFTYERLKAGIEGTDPDAVARELEVDIEKFRAEHRITTATLYKQVTV